MKFVWWIFITLIIVSAIASDVDHFIINKEGKVGIHNWHCMRIGFWSGTEGYPECQRPDAYQGRLFHHPFIWAALLGTMIGGWIPWPQD